MNKLINEKSLYLQDHATNPINWYPWGSEAFIKAQEENKPIFLSIGYATCHWCHVMKRESFQDLEIANILNKYYVSIKVDREERPDVDILYMQVASKFLGRGGWPLNVIITPHQEPFFITTYLPKEKLKKILIKINNEWTLNKIELINNSKQIIELLKKDSDNTNIKLNSYDKIIHQTKNILQSNFDKNYGGFQTRPKFPTSHYLLFLLYYYKAFNDKESLEMGLKTLYQMYKGGIFDHLNYGFSRYAVDEFWLVPHFEKMLYDNAMLLITYLLYYSETKDKLLKDIAIKIIYFLESTLKDATGAFYSAIDADSEGIEGKYYIWSYLEIYKNLSNNELKQITEYFNISPEGNFEGYNIFNIIHKSDEEIKNDIPEEIQHIINKLKNIQKNRVHPRIDKKILTSWNSIVIWAYTLAGKILNNNEYLITAKNTANYILQNLMDQDEELYTRISDNEKKHLANLEDYAYFINSLIILYLETHDEFYLYKANELTNKVVELFHDNINGGFYFTRANNNLIIRPKEHYDGPIPSGNSMMVYNLIRLNNLIYNPKYIHLIKEIFAQSQALATNSPTSLPFLLLSFIEYKTNKTHIIIVYKDENDITLFKEILNTKFNPFITILYLNKSNLLHSKSFSDYQISEEFAVFICTNGICDEPIYEIDEALQLIKEICL